MREFLLSTSVNPLRPTSRKVCPPPLGFKATQSLQSVTEIKNPGKQLPKLVSHDSNLYGSQSPRFISHNTRLPERQEQKSFNGHFQQGELTRLLIFHAGRLALNVARIGRLTEPRLTALQEAARFPTPTVFSASRAYSSLRAAEAPAAARVAKAQVTANTDG